MSIVQISKIQQRSGNIVDLPQLDEAELGFATDAKLLFIGKGSPNENIEVLTSYSTIAFGQLDGSVGNLNISAISIDDGQLLIYDGSNWVNRGGDVGGLITLGEVSNVKITGGAIGYVLETDGLGNLSWTPKTTVTSFIQNATKANPCVITTTEDNFFTDGAKVTITNVPGMTQLSGNTYYVDVISSNTFSLYSDLSLTTPIDSTGFSTFPNTTATATTLGTNIITVGNSAPFTIGNPVKFIGTTFGGIIANTVYYIKTKPSGTQVTISLTPGGANVILSTASGTSTVYETGGRVISSISGSGGATAGGSNTTIQFNNSSLLDGDADFTWNSSTNLLNINGNANVGNLSASSVITASRYISNVATGTEPLTVTSTTRVANLNVSHSNVSDFGAVTAQTTGTFFPVFANGSATANRALAANANLGFDVANGNLSSTIFHANSSITSLGNVTGNRLVASVATGTAPIIVNSTTRVANLNVELSGIAEAVNITTVSSGTFYPILANAITGNVSESANANLSFNAATETLSSTLLAGTLTTNAQPNITSLGTLTSLTVSGTVTANDIATFGTTGDTLNITGANNTTLNGVGGNIQIIAGLGNGTGTGGAVLLRGANGNPVGTGSGGQVIISGGASSTTTGLGGNVEISGGNSSNTATGGRGSLITLMGGTSAGVGGGITFTAGNANGENRLGGDITISAGRGTGSANAGKIILQTSIPGGTGNTLQNLANRAIIDDTSINVVMTTAATSTTTGAIVVAGGVGVSGNIYAGVFYGAGNGLSNIQGASVSGAVSSATTAVTAGTVTTNAQPNITSTGTLTSLSVAYGTITGISPILLTQTWNNSAVTFTGTRQNITDLASAAGSSLLDLQVNGATQFNVNKNGNIIVGPTGGGGITATSINVTNLTTGANTTGGIITGNWTLSAGSRLNATYADLAEYYESDQEYEPGTVLEFGGDKEVTIAKQETNKVAGVVSTDPAYVMNTKCIGIAVAIALQGRVPVKVCGKIKKGDMMVSGGNGYAKASSSPGLGTVIGKSLENFEGTTGIIEIAVGRL